MAENTTLVRIQATDETQKAFSSANASINKTKANLSDLARVQNAQRTATMQAARQSRQGLAQLGYQIQDISVQLQGGQSPFIVLGQQGSQVASIFGPYGAVAGAFVAIGAALATVMMPNIFDSTNALEKLTEAGEEASKLFKTLDDDTVVLSESFAAMAEASRSAAVIELRRQRAEIESALEQTRIEIEQKTGAFGRAFAEVDALTAAHLASVGQSVESVAAKIQREFGVTEESMRTLYDLGESARAGGMAEISAFLDAIAETQAQPGVTDKFTELAESLSVLFVEASKGDASLAQIESALSDLDSFISKTRESTDKTDDSIEKMIASLQKQADTFGFSETAIAVYEARLAGATIEQQEQIATLAGEVELRERAIEALKEETKAREEQEKASAAARAVIQKEALALADPIDQINQSYVDRQDALREALQTEGIIQTEHNQLMIDLEKDRIDAIAEYERESYDKQMQMVQARYQAAGQLAGALAGVFEEGTTAQRAFLAVQKGLAVGEAVMNMHRAIANANTVPWPDNFAAIAQAASTGMSAIAGIKATSFEGGGFTGYGARAGGLDGRGGMPAIVHPNETIVDHTKGGAPVNVNITIQANDTRGFDQLLAKRRGMIASMVQSSLNNVGRTI